MIELTYVSILRQLCQHYAEKYLIELGYRGSHGRRGRGKNARQLDLIVDKKYLFFDLNKDVISSYYGFGDVNFYTASYLCQCRVVVKTIIREIKYITLFSW